MPSAKGRKGRKVLIRKDDIVEVRVGKDKGKRGRVLRVFPREDRVIVEKANMIKRHTRPTQRQRGGIMEKEAKIHVSDVMVVCPKTAQPSRVGWRTLEDGRKVRYLKKSGEILDTD